MEYPNGSFFHSFLTKDRLNAVSIPALPSFKQYSINNTNSTEVRETRADNSVTYIESGSEEKGNYFRFHGRPIVEVDRDRSIIEYSQ